MSDPTFDDPNREAVGLEPIAADPDETATPEPEPAPEPEPEPEPADDDE